MNIAEILKKYPEGTKLYSLLCGECKFITVEYDMYPIHVQTNDGFVFRFTKDGKYKIDGECVLFPSKDNRDWNTMKTDFKKGDFVYRKLVFGNEWISIHYNLNPNNKIGDVESLVDICIDDDYVFNIDKKPLCFRRDIKVERFATKEEKHLLLKTLDKAGYMWDEEKLEVRKKQKKYCFTPFEKVLVRDYDISPWELNLFSHLNDRGYPFGIN